MRKPSDERIEAALAVKAQDQKPTALLDQSNPVALVEGATVIADQLSRIVSEQKLFKVIKGRKHVLVEGWTTLGAMSGVFPYVEYARRVETKNPKEIQYEARVLAKTRSGEVIGAAEAICSNEEHNWKDRDEYAIKSMAQTRATSKALRLPLGWIMTLSGFDATPADEMPDEAVRPRVNTSGTTTQTPQAKAQEKAQEAMEPPTTGDKAEDDAIKHVDKIVDKLIDDGYTNITEDMIIREAKDMPGIKLFQVKAIEKYLKGGGHDSGPG